MRSRTALLHAQPVGLLEARLGLGAAFAEQPVMLVEAVPQGMGDFLGDRVFAGRDFHRGLFPMLQCKTGGYRQTAAPAKQPAPSSKPKLAKRNGMADNIYL
jgi:hypothetical protein